MPPKKISPETRKKGGGKWPTLSILLLTFLLLWFTSTWVISITALKKKHNGETVQKSRRNAKDISSYFTHKLQPTVHTNSDTAKHNHHVLQPESKPKTSRGKDQQSLPLTAYLEGPLPPYDPSKTPRLPSRTPGPLKSILYGHSTCQDFPNAFPIQVPKDGTDCPIMQDPFLPWIHDAFVDVQGTVQFIAHNSRRCNTNPKDYYDRLTHLEPQAILQQSVPIQVVGNNQYQLTSLEQANHKETRFLCRFHDDQNQVIAITFSTYQYNYEHANYQKRNAFALLTRPKDNQDVKNALHNEQVWNSLLIFQCPLPKELQPIFMANAGSAPSFYVDVVPIRTYGRLDRAGYFDRSSRGMASDDVTFDAQLEWGDHHVLPPIQASGRWANIPLCLAQQHVAQEAKQVIANNQQQPPPYFWTACVWASASFTTRGSNDADTSTSQRLLEWLTYQLYMAGLDHIYVYDNSQGTATLEPVLDLFPSTKVTRIPWKHPVCNNNKPGAPNPGERSSQYTAESSCRVRFGPLTEWMTVLDTDEYLIPQAPHASIREWLQHAYSDGPTKILSFYQTRALPNKDYLDPVPNGQDLQYQWQKKPEATYLETYNCDKTTFPKPGWAWRAKKQIFQPSYVLMHFVHYSLVTTRLLEHPTERSGLYNDHAPYEKRVDEQKEAFLLHAKTTSPAATQYWKKQCVANRKDNDCPIGIAFPPNTKEGAVNEEGLPYNCFSHERITKDIVPKLKSLLQPLQVKYQESLKGD